MGNKKNLFIIIPIIVVVIAIVIVMIFIVKNQNNTTSANEKNDNKVSETVNLLKINENKSPYVLYPAKGIEGGVLCRVLYDADSENGLQIVTVNPVEKVKLYDTTYNIAIETLNSYAEEYIDNQGIAKDARCIGSNPKDKNAEKQDKIGDYEYLTKHNINGSYKTGDSNYVEDKEQLEKINALTITDASYSTRYGEGYWLASRENSADSAYASFRVRCVEVYEIFGHLESRLSKAILLTIDSLRK